MDGTFGGHAAGFTACSSAVRGGWCSRAGLAWAWGHLTAAAMPVKGCREARLFQSGMVDRSGMGEAGTSPKETFPGRQVSSGTGCLGAVQALSCPE